MLPAEQSRPDIAFKRARWQAHQGKIDPRRLVFIDETWIKTNMAPLRGWGLRGQRLGARVPHGHWKTLTLIAALRHDRVDAPCVIDGPINGDLFTAYVEQVLVECIGKGKARTRFEFGCKISLATTNRPPPGGQFVIGARALPGNPFDGHTLAAQIAQTERITGVSIERAYVDRGYRGQDADKQRVFVSGQKRGVTPTIRREIRRRAGIEPVIGHMKENGHLGRNFLAGAAGDAINVVLAAAGHNLRLLRAWLIRLLAFLLSLIAISGPAAQLPSPQLAAR